MNDIILVGSGGYIGTRLLDRLRRAGHDPIYNLDLDIYGRNHQYGIMPNMDVLSASDAYFENAIVVYLASFHREPNVDNLEKYSSSYQDVMVNKPYLIAQEAKHLIYISSMRALTDTQSLYGACKAAAERAFIHTENVTVIRPGTVWGDLSEGWPNRCNTALNFALTRKLFSGDHWSAFTTHMRGLIGHIEDLINDIFLGNVNHSQYQIVTDLPVPLTAPEVRLLLENKHDCRTLQTIFTRELERTPEGLDLDEDKNAEVRLRNHYGLV